MGGQGRPPARERWRQHLAVPGRWIPVLAERREHPDRDGGRIVIPAARPEVGIEEADAAHRVIMSGMLAQGPEVAAFEQEFADQVVPGTQAVALNSGTS